jgi:hypothetical protein
MPKSHPKDPRHERFRKCISHIFIALSNNQEKLFKEGMTYFGSETIVAWIYYCGPGARLNILAEQHGSHMVGRK